MKSIVRVLSVIICLNEIGMTLLDNETSISAMLSMNGSGAPKVATQNLPILSVPRVIDLGNLGDGDPNSPILPQGEKEAIINILENADANSVFILPIADLHGRQERFQEIFTLVDLILEYKLAGTETNKFTKQNIVVIFNGDIDWKYHKTFSSPFLLNLPDYKNKPTSKYHRQIMQSRIEKAQNKEYKVTNTSYPYMTRSEYSTVLGHMNKAAVPNLTLVETFDQLIQPLKSRGIQIIVNLGNHDTQFLAMFYEFITLMAEHQIPVLCHIPDAFATDWQAACNKFNERVKKVIGPQFTEEEAQPFLTYPCPKQDRNQIYIYSYIVVGNTLILPYNTACFDAETATKIYSLKLEYVQDLAGSSGGLSDLRRKYKLPKSVEKNLITKNTQEMYNAGLRELLERNPDPNTPLNILILGHEGYGVHKMPEGGYSEDRLKGFLEFIWSDNPALTQSEWDRVKSFVIATGHDHSNYTFPQNPLHILSLDGPVTKHVDVYAPSMFAQQIPFITTMPLDKKPLDHVNECAVRYITQHEKDRYPEEAAQTKNAIDKKKSLKIMKLEQSTNETMGPTIPTEINAEGSEALEDLHLGKSEESED